MRSSRWLTAVAVLAVAVLALVVWRGNPSPAEPPPPPEPAASEPTPPASSFAGSSTCEACHSDIVEQWAGSHHALAEVPFDPSVHGAAFVPDRLVKHGEQTSSIRAREDSYAVVTEGADGEVAPFSPQRIIGVSPLWQPVVAGERGRFQVTSLAYDPVHDEWFDIFGDEDRRPHEWGFWANRGMTWNSMCGSCHTTGFEKNYDPDADSYDTEYTELGVGCEACHGPSARHVAAMRDGSDTPAARSPEASPGWPPDSVFTERPATGPAIPASDLARTARALDTCGACHARRADLTGSFRPGDAFLDHYRPSIPDETDLFYPDGQVWAEDFEYTSFLSSRMYAAGVRCVHCHDPHTARPHAEGNALCLSCHEGRIDPAPHSNHDIEGPGGQCTDCHMPLTTYMQRHPRRDHGFTIPDPTLTRDFDIPNACNRCHQDETVQWAVDWTDRWYGERMNRHTQTRARALARARRGDPGAGEGLAALLSTETAPFWRAAALGLSGPWLPTEPALQRVLVDSLADPDPLVRTTATRMSSELLEAPRITPTTQRRLQGLVTGLLEDPVRSVRLDAAWVLRRSLPPTHAVSAELESYLRFNSDQPTGALRLGAFHLDRRADPKDLDRAVAWMEKAVAWDPNAPFLHQSLAIAYSTTGDQEGALEHMARAHALEPDEAMYAYNLALGLAEAKRYDEATQYLQAATVADPAFGRAWYNLALVHAHLDADSKALDAIDEAIAVEPENVDYVYAKATLLRDMSRYKEALDAVAAAEQLAPGAPALLQLRAALEEALRQATSASGGPP